MFLSIILATYNERDNIIPLYDLINKELSNKVKYEVIYVDDNSRDGSIEKIKYLSVYKKNVKYILRKNKRGLSSAQLTGAAEASGNLILFMDSDMQHNPKYIMEMVNLIKNNNYNIVSASRFLNNKNFNLKEKRYKLSKIIINLINFVFDLNKTDILTGYFILKKNILIENKKFFSTKGFKLLLDIFFNSKTKLLHTEIPFDFEPRNYGESKLNFEIIIEFFYLMINYFSNRYVPFRYFLYSIIGCIGLTLQFIILYLFTYLINLEFIYSNMIAIVIAMTLNFFLNNISTFFDIKIKKENYFEKLLKFYLICFVGIIINYSVFYLIYANFNLIFLSIFIGTFIGSIWNFWINSKFTWNDI